jgi:hypothetical protein
MCWCLRTLFSPWLAPGRCECAASLSEPWRCTLTAHRHYPFLGIYAASGVAGAALQMALMALATPGAASVDGGGQLDAAAHGLAAAAGAAGAPGAVGPAAAIMGVLGCLAAHFAVNGWVPVGGLRTPGQRSVRMDPDLHATC